ncbi:unnamed protein product [Trypanosoma congolense IL3000]|uniref:WGS project CAEQ00000000 data, annotated contig 1039 n=1 Tax=Trypanosoma congolense (strain IL3000) TaxID=1068625 RepID=F9W3D2_TRYCI|nr:unnamed protein product [Trypanosoma congolense IL3000]
MCAKLLAKCVFRASTTRITEEEADQKAMAYSFCGRAAVFSLSAGAVSLLRSSSASGKENMDSVNCSKQLSACMHFVDTHVTKWQTLYSSFPKDENYDVVKNATAIEVLQLEPTYSTGREGDAAVPVLRLFTFLPGVGPKDVYRYITDVKLRRRWDHNYTMFCRWKGEEAETAGMLDSIQRPIEAVARRTRVCDGNTCLLIPDITSRVVESGWFAHGVGNSLLLKFGIAERMFVYERRSVCYTKRGDDDDGLMMYDVLYSGTEYDVQRKRARCADFREWFRTFSEGRNALLGSMYCQHLIIIPISDAVAQLREGVQHLERSGSIVDEKATKAMYKMFMDSIDRFKDKQNLDGTLVIMTSANDAKISNRTPLWVQKVLCNFFSKYAYNQLISTITADNVKVN